VLKKERKGREISSFSKANHKEGARRCAIERRKKLSVGKSSQGNVGRRKNRLYFSPGPGCVRGKGGERRGLGGLRRQRRVGGKVKASAAACERFSGVLGPVGKKWLCGVGPFNAY